MDIFSVLKNDHKEVKNIFEEILKIEDLDTKKIEKLCSMLTIHMELEEKLVYPVFQKHKEVAELTKEAFLEHDEAKKLIRSLKKEGLENEELKVKCEMLQLAINHHVDEEEGEVFPKAKKVLPDQEIRSLGEAFIEHKQKRLERVK